MIQKKIIVNIFFSWNHSTWKFRQITTAIFIPFCAFLWIPCMHTYAWSYRKFVKSSNKDFYFEIRRFHGNFISVKSIDKEISVVRTLLLTHKYVLHHWKSISRIFFTCCVLKKEQKFGSSTFTVWKNEKFSLTVKYFVKSTL